MAEESIVTINFKNEDPIIYVKHLYYGTNRNRKLSNISGAVFKDLKNKIYEELVQHFKSLKGNIDNCEKNEYFNIINKYKKHYLNHKKEISSLKSNIKVIEKKYRELLSKNNRLEASYSNSYYYYIKEKKQRKEAAKTYEYIIHNRNEEMLKIFGLIENKKEYIKDNPNSYLSAIICGHCFNVCENKNKCIQPDCLGLCSHCNNKPRNKNICLSCNKKREIECPICFEKCKEDSVFKNPSGKCDHSICYKCFQSSFYDAKKPIEKCPLCRKDFVKS